MADAVTSQTLTDGDKTAVMKFTNISDGSGESSVKKVDVSALTTSTRNGSACTRVHITQIWYMISGMRIDLEWDASSNVKALILGGGVTLEPTMGHLDFRSFGGIKNNAGGGITGDIDLTTLHHTSNDAYTIILELSKSY
tara:strand:- start:265 stop:684 length:420 start_codon:yes stop_codon:yes gene_type:complete